MPIPLSRPRSRLRGITVIETLGYRDPHLCYEMGQNHHKKLIKSSFISYLIINTWLNVVKDIISHINFMWGAGMMKNVWWNDILQSIRSMIDKKSEVTQLTTLAPMFLILGILARGGEISSKLYRASVCDMKKLPDPFGLRRGSSYYWGCHILTQVFKNTRG